MSKASRKAEVRRFFKSHLDNGEYSDAVVVCEACATRIRNGKETSGCA